MATKSGNTLESCSFWSGNSTDATFKDTCDWLEGLNPFTLAHVIFNDGDISFDASAYRCEPKVRMATHELAVFIVGFPGYRSFMVPQRCPLALLARVPPPDGKDPPLSCRHVNSAEHLSVYFYDVARRNIIDWKQRVRERSNIKSSESYVFGHHKMFDEAKRLLGIVVSLRVEINTPL